MSIKTNVAYNKNLSVTFVLFTSGLIYSGQDTNKYEMYTESNRVVNFA